MKFTTLIALIGVAAAASNPDVIALAKKNELVVKSDMKALVTLLDTIEKKDAEVMKTKLAARKTELKKDMKAHPERKEEIRSELVILKSVASAMEKKDFEAGLAALSTRKDHLMELHKQYQAKMNEADTANLAGENNAPVHLSDDDSDDDDSDDDDSDDDDSDDDDSNDDDSDDDDSNDDDSNDDDSDSDWWAAEKEAGTTNLAAKKDNAAVHLSDDDSSDSDWWAAEHEAGTTNLPAKDVDEKTVPYKKVTF